MSTTPSSVLQTGDRSSPVDHLLSISSPVLSQASPIMSSSPIDAKSPSPHPPPLPSPPVIDQSSSSTSSTIIRPTPTNTPIILNIPMPSHSPPAQLIQTNRSPSPNTAVQHISNQSNQLQSPTVVQLVNNQQQASSQQISQQQQQQQQQQQSSSPLSHNTLNLLGPSMPMTLPLDVLIHPTTGQLFQINPQTHQIVPFIPQQQSLAQQLNQLAMNQSLVAHQSQSSNALASLLSGHNQILQNQSHQQSLSQQQINQSNQSAVNQTSLLQRQTQQQAQQQTQQQQQQVQQQLVQQAISNANDQQQQQQQQQQMQQLLAQPRAISATSTSPTVGNSAMSPLLRSTLTQQHSSGSSPSPPLTSPLPLSSPAPINVTNTASNPASALPVVPSSTTSITSPQPTLASSSPLPNQINTPQLVNNATLSSQLSFPFGTLNPSAPLIFNPMLPVQTPQSQANNQNLHATFKAMGLNMGMQLALPMRTPGLAQFHPMQWQQQYAQLLQQAQGNSSSTHPLMFSSAMNVQPLTMYQSPGMLPDQFLSFANNSQSQQSSSSQQSSNTNSQSLSQSQSQSQSQQDQMLAQQLQGQLSQQQSHQSLQSLQAHSQSHLQQSGASTSSQNQQSSSRPDEQPKTSHSRSTKPSDSMADESHHANSSSPSHHKERKSKKVRGKDRERSGSKKDKDKKESKKKKRHRERAEAKAAAELAATTNSDATVPPLTVDNRHVAAQPSSVDTNTQERDAKDVAATLSMLAAASASVPATSIEEKHTVDAATDEHEHRRNRDRDHDRHSERDRESRRSSKNKERVKRRRLSSSAQEIDASTINMPHKSSKMSPSSSPQHSVSSSSPPPYVLDPYPPRRNSEDLAAIAQDDQEFRDNLLRAFSATAASLSVGYEARSQERATSALERASTTVRAQPPHLVRRNRTNAAIGINHADSQTHSTKGLDAFPQAAHKRKQVFFKLKPLEGHDEFKAQVKRLIFARRSREHVKEIEKRRLVHSSYLDDGSDDSGTDATMTDNDVDMDSLNGGSSMAGVKSEMLDLNNENGSSDHSSDQTMKSEDPKDLLSPVPSMTPASAPPPPPVELSPLEAANAAVEQCNDDISSLSERLKRYQSEKHQLFEALKHVLNEERKADEKKKERSDETEANDDNNENDLLGPALPNSRPQMSAHSQPTSSKQAAGRTNLDSDDAPPAKSSMWMGTREEHRNQQGGHMNMRRQQMHHGNNRMPRPLMSSLLHSPPMQPHQTAPQQRHQQHQNLGHIHPERIMLAQQPISQQQQPFSPVRNTNPRAPSQPPVATASQPSSVQVLASPRHVPHQPSHQPSSYWQDEPEHQQQQHPHRISFNRYPPPPPPQQQQQQQRTFGQQSTTALHQQQPHHAHFHQQQSSTLQSSQQQHSSTWGSRQYSSPFNSLQHHVSSYPPLPPPPVNVNQRSFANSICSNAAASTQPPIASPPSSPHTGPSGGFGSHWETSRSRFAPPLPLGYNTLHHNAHHSQYMPPPQQPPPHYERRFPGQAQQHPRQR